MGHLVQHASRAEEMLQRAQPQHSRAVERPGSEQGWKTAPWKEQMPAATG